MKISENEYSQLVKKASKPSPKIKDFVWAFIVGGIICTIGQLIIECLKNRGVDEKIIKAAVPVILIFLSALLTGLKIFEKIAKHAGAGTLVPITGFANAVVSPAIEFKNEGHVLGIGAKIFTIAGPVILFGTSASVLYGIVYYICKML